MQRELSSFPFPPSHRLKLHNAGFITAEDVLELKPTELSKELGISKEDALEIIQTVKTETCSQKHLSPSSITPSTPEGSTPSTSSKGSSQKSHGSSSNRTALDMLRDEQLQQNIITFSEKIDGILGGGVPLTKITEICGAPGVGKTQFSIQLTVDVQIPQCFGGVEGEAIYIDTEGSFIVDRVVDIAKATVNHCQHLADLQNDQDQHERMQSFTFESILGGIHYFRCHDYIELLALIHTLPDFLREKPKVSLIVLDSVAFPFRHDFEDFSLRTRLLNGLAQSFIRMATDFKLAVLLTNQMTTKISTDRSVPSHLIPALGESWGHASTIRIILYWRQNQRFALLYKSPTHGEATVPYQITTGGIRDVHLVESQQDHEARSPILDGLARKRQRTDS